MGNKHQQELDYKASGGSPLRFERIYNSSSTANNGLGIGWRSSYARSISFVAGGSGFDSVATLRRADGKQFSFKQGLVNTWIGDADVVGRLTLLGVDAMGKPTGWRFTDERNEIEIFDAAGKLQSIVDRTGKVQILSYSCWPASATCPSAALPTIAPVVDLLLAVTDFTGRTLEFAYDPSARIRTLTSSTGTALSFDYTNTTVRANLSKVTYPGGAIRSYMYGEPTHVSPTPDVGIVYTNALTGIMDENDRRYATWSYNAQGRATSSEHAAGIDKVKATYNNDGSALVTDALGVSRIFGFSTMFNVAKSYGVQGLPCPGCIPSIGFDLNGNIASADDFNGNRVCYTNDLDRNLESARVEGLANTAVCSAVSPSGASLPASSRKISRQWHPDWRLESKRAEPLKLTTWVYNGQPDPFNSNAIASCAPTSALLPDGKPTAVLCKQVEQATTDVDGHLGFGAALQPGVASRQQSWTYNQYGQVLTAKGPRTDLDDTTSYLYYPETTVEHTMGDLAQMTNALGQVTSYPKYNKHGQVLQMVDPNGIVTENTYDPRQRPTSTSVGGLQTMFSYDPVGQLLKLTLPDKTSLTYTYDDAHRLTKVTDQAGNLVSYTLDNAGNRTQEQIKDSSGNLSRTITRAFDALGRVQQQAGGL